MDGFREVCDKTENILSKAFFGIAVHIEVRRYPRHDRAADDNAFGRRGDICSLLRRRDAEADGDRQRV